MENATPTTNRQFRLQLSQTEWTALEYVAKHNGKTDIKRFIRSELYRFAKKNKDLIPPGLPRSPKKTKHYMIPSDLLGFYENLAYHYNADMAKVIYKFVLMPTMIDANDNHVAINMARRAFSSTQTNKPAFTTSSNVSYTVK